MKKSWDILIVGGGGSGMAAAVSAAELGCSVLVLEKQASLGGTTALAVGSFTANLTRQQEAAGIKDSLESHLEDLARFAPPELEARNNQELRKLFLLNAADTLRWLEGMGLGFFGPSPEPPNRVPRMHNVVPGARAYILALKQRFLSLGGCIRCRANVVELVREGRRVSGVRVRCGTAEEVILASKGVVLAAGDYANSPELITEYKGTQFSRIEGINVHAQGDGQRLARSVGARLVNMDVTYGPELRFVPPPRPFLIQRLPAGGIVAIVLGKLAALLPRWALHMVVKRLVVLWQHPEDKLFTDGAILLNARGERFCNELESPGREIAIAEQPGKQAFILLDEALAERYSGWPHFISTAPQIAYAYVADYERLRPDVTCTARSLPEIARLRNLPGYALERTVVEFNHAVKSGRPDRFGRKQHSRIIEGDRWVLLGPAKSYFTTTEGGPAIDVGFGVRDANDEPIPGLYAIGQNGLGGQILWGHGLKIGWALTSGRLLGRILAGSTEMDAANKSVAPILHAR